MLNKKLKLKNNKINKKIENNFMDCILFMQIYVTGPCHISRRIVYICKFNKRVKILKNNGIFKQI